MMSEMLSYLRIRVASPFIVAGVRLTLAGYAATFVAELISGVEI